MAACLHHITWTRINRLSIQKTSFIQEKTVSTGCSQLKFNDFIKLDGKQQNPLDWQALDCVCFGAIVQALEELFEYSA